MGVTNMPHSLVSGGTGSTEMAAKLSYCTSLDCAPVGLKGADKAWEDDEWSGVLASI